MTILHLTTILPAPVSTKRRENDILMRLAKEYEKKYPGSRHHFIYITPYSNWFFALLKKKWREYLEIIRKGSFSVAGYEITVVGIPAFKNDVHLRKVLSWLGFKIFNKRINEVITKIKPDVIHAHNMHSCIDLAELIKRKYGIRYIVTARSINHRVLKRIHSGKLKLFCIISHNQVSANRCKDKGVPVNIIPHPVDEMFFKSDKAEPATNRNILKLVSVCGLVKLKNIDKVIKALQKVTFKFSYTIFGDGPETVNLRGLASSLNLNDFITFEGFQPHEIIAGQLPNFDLFVMPSFPETLGRVYFESMASGLPVVATRNTGIDGMIQQNVHGYLVDPENIDEITNTLNSYFELPADQKLEMKNNAQHYARQFTWAKTLKAYHQLYHAG
jgi:glycosyltransferase involved in cell wall biosynthesis